MKKTGSFLLVLFFMVVGILFLFGCATNVSNANAQTDEANADEDYLPVGTVLAGIMWQDGYWSEFTFYPSEILTNPDEGNNKYEVMVLTGDADVEKGSKHWTSNIILKSHPAEKGELKINMVVLALFDSNDGFTKAELAKKSWRRYVILDISNLTNGFVKLGEFENFDSPEPMRIMDVPVKNIRISDDPDLGLKP